jgi:hypothetical protein
MGIGCLRDSFGDKNKTRMNGVGVHLLEMLATAYKRTRSPVTLFVPRGVGFMDRCNEVRNQWEGRYVHGATLWIAWQWWQMAKVSPLYHHRIHLSHAMPVLC